MTRLGEALRALTGWRRLLVAIVLGALSATAFPPFYVFPALLIALKEQYMALMRNLRSILSKSVIYLRQLNIKWR